MAEPTDTTSQATQPEEGAAAEQAAAPVPGAGTAAQPAAPGPTAGADGPPPGAEPAAPDADARPAADAAERERDAAEPVEHDLEALTAKARERDEFLALAQRTQADFENFRKRMTREVGQASERGVTKLAKELLPALDHFDLALRSVEGDEEVRKGFTLVRDELLNALGRVGIQAFSPKGEAFDPTQHEAMVAQPVEGAESGTVVEVYQQGYRINGAVIRPARVVVAA